MQLRSKTTLLTIAAVTALAVPGAAQARQGADDPAPQARHGLDDLGVHLRHGLDDVVSRVNGKNKVRTRSRIRRHGADDAPGDDRGAGRGRGADDAPGDDRGGARIRARGADDAPGDDRGGRGRGRGADDGPNHR